MTKTPDNLKAQIRKIFNDTHCTRLARKLWPVLYKNMWDLDKYNLLHLNLKEIVELTNSLDFIS